MSKKVAIWLVFKWEDFLSQLKGEEWSEGDIVFISDTPIMSSQTVALTENVRSVCRKLGITLIEDYDELLAEIYKRKLAYREEVLSEVMVDDRPEDEAPV
jgi:hypothetical protein